MAEELIVDTLTSSNDEALNEFPNSRLNGSFAIKYKHLLGFVYEYDFPAHNVSQVSTFSSISSNISTISTSAGEYLKLKFNLQYNKTLKKFSWSKW